MHARWALWAIGLCCACDADSVRGASCQRERDCDAMVCTADPSTPPDDLETWPLTCSDARGSSPPMAACERATDCASGLCLLAGACAAPCADGADCADGSDCREVYARSSAASFARAAACVGRVDLPSDASVASTVQRGALSGGLDRITLPPSAATTLYVLEHLGDRSWPIPPATSTCRPPLCARTLRARDGDDVLFDRDALPQDGPLNGVASGDYVNPLGVLIPNGPRLQPSAAGYTLELESTQSGDLRLTTLSRSDSGRRLELNLYYVGARELAPEGVRGVPQLQAALEELERIFEPAEIFLGEVRQSNIAGELLERGVDLQDAEVSAGFRVLRAQYQVLPQLPELLKLSAGAANSALDIFFVADIAAAGGGDVGGISGGTPVPFGMHGTPGSGIVIAAAMLLDDSAKLGRVLAHEIGHALGLFHTTELSGEVFDPLPDTPVCPIARDTDHDGALDARECQGLGGDNVMFPTDDTSGVTLTPDQIAVLQSALILQ
jgi:hypothetical protein